MNSSISNNRRPQNLFLDLLAESHIFINSREVICENPHKAEKKLEQLLRSRQCWEEFLDALEEFLSASANDSDGNEQELPRLILCNTTFEKPENVQHHELLYEQETSSHNNTSSTSRSSSSSSSSSIRFASTLSQHSRNHTVSDDTLLKLLLRISKLQKRLLVFLVGKMMDMSSDDNLFEDIAPSNSNINNLSQRSLARQQVLMIFNLIRWCDVIYDPLPLLHILVQSLEMVPKWLQIEMVTALPLLVGAEDITSRKMSADSMTDEQDPMVPKITVCEYLLNALQSLVDSNAGMFLVSFFSNRPSLPF